LLPESMPAARPVQTGDLIRGTYLVEHVLGQGATGVVFCAQHLALGQRVALKLIRPEIVQQLAAATSLRRQARAVAAIQSEHVCRVLDLQVKDAEPSYVVSEYVEGPDLARGTSSGGASNADIVGWMLQACAGLAAALQLALVHRDLKPSKLVLADRPDGTRCLKLLDLGSAGVVYDAAPLAAAGGRGASGESERWLRARRYAAPEQLDAIDRVDPRTNVWALGAIGYELLGGRLPFEAASPQGLIEALRGATPEPLHELAEGVSRGLSGVVHRALAKSREDRYPSAFEFAEALAPYAPARALRSARELKSVRLGAG
jgi:eukaryotic-like serine/threonine-protein kinase